MASLKELYTALKADGAPLPDTYEKFSNYMTSGPQDGYAHRKEVYDALKADGAPLPDTYEEFSRALFSTNTVNDATSPTGSSQTGRAEAKQTVTSFKMRRGGRDFSIPVEEVNAAGGLQGWADAHPGAPVRVYMQGKNDDGSDFKGHVDLSQAHERNRTKGYKYQTVETERFKPTDLDKKRMSANISRTMQQHDAAMQDIRTRQEDVMEYASKGNGMNFGQAVKSKPQMNPETGEMEDTWLTPDGKRTTSKAVADLESFNYRMATDMSIGGQLRRANERLADIEKRLDERGKELMAQHDKNSPKGIAGFIKEAGQMVMADKVGGAPMQNPEDYAEFTQDKDYQALRLARRKISEEIQKLQNAKERETRGERFWHDFGRATAQALKNPDSWDFGMAQFKDATTMMQLNKAVESGKELSQAENDALTELYLYDNVQNQYGDLGKGDRWGEIAGSSLSFMKDFLLTGGFSGVGTKIPTAVAKKVAFNAAKKMGTDLAGKKVAVEIAEKGVLNYIRKGGKGAVGRLLASQGKAGLASTMVTKAVGVAAEDLLVRAPLMTFGVQGQSTAAKIIETKLGPVSLDENTGELYFVNDKDWGEAAWQAGADQVIENYSEMWGAHVPAMSDVGKFFGARNLTAAVLRATRENAGTVLSKTNKFLARAGVKGYFGEVGEEYYGQLWRTMLNLDSAKDPEGNNLLGSGQFHGDIWGGMALSIGMTSVGAVAGSYGVQGAQKGVSSAVYLHHKKNMQRSAKRASTVFGADEWENLQLLIDSQDNDGMGAFAESVMADPDMTQQQKDAAMDYMEKAMTFRGYNLGEMLRAKAGASDPGEQELSQSYIDGYEGTSIQEMTDAANMYQLQYQKLMEAFDDMDEGNLNRIMNDIHSDPVAAISKTGEEMRPLMLDYANALMVYRGMEQRFNDDMESRVAQAEWEADANTNRQTGQIQPGVMETDDRQVYVVNGRVALLDNGDIDTADSDDTIIIRDAETGRLEFANPKDLSSMGDAQDPVALKEQQGAAIRQQMEQEHSDKMSGRLSLEAGSVVSVPGGDGMVNATITGPAVDEQGRPVEAAVTVQSEDGSVETYSVEDLQAWADEANRRRVQDFEDEREAQRSAETASHSEDENASQPVMAMPPFALNDEFTILNPEIGEPIHGEVTGELDEDGTVEIYTNMPMNGSLVNKVRPEDLAGMIDTYNGERLEDMPVGTPSAPASAQIDSEGDSEFGPEDVTYKLSEEHNEFGKPFVQSSDGTTEFGFIEEDSGLAALPIRLSLGENYQDENGNNHGYGYLHIEAEHKAQILQHGFSSVEEFVETVARNYTDIKEGAKIGNNQTYLLEVSDEHNNTLFIQLSRDGKYWNVNSAGIFKKRYSRRKPEVYSRPAVGSGKGTDTTEVNSGLSKGATAPAGNSSETSDGKVNNSASEKQENQGESLSASPTALERIPRNEKGEPVFEQAETPELGWDALVEARGGEVGKAQVVADIMAEIKRKAYEKLQKQKPKGNTPSEIIASQDAIDAELAQAELEYKQWQDIANVERVRQAAIQAEQEDAEREAAELAAAEEAERKALEKADKRFGEVYDKVKGNALAVERLRQLEPETIYEAASAVLSRGKILWDNNGGSRGFKQETGYGEGERKKMFSMFATKENGGRSLRRLAEDEMQETCALAGIPYDNVDAFNALTEVISEAQVPSDIRNYIKNSRIEQALEIYDHEQAAERAAYEEWCYQNFGMSAEEYEAYEEQREEEIRNALENFDENEYFSNIADELIERENERRRVEEAVTQGESTGDVGGGEVLSTQGLDTQGGRSADADRQGVPEGNGNQVVDTTGAVPEGASGGEGEQIASIGFGKFGQIFAAFRGKAKEAWRYLSALQSGQARGVFYRPEIGEIDLVWGDAPTPYSGKGLAHIDRKHVETLGDFSSMEEAIDTIDDVITNGEYIEQDSRTAIFDKGNYRVVVAREESGNWVLTAFDNKTPAKEKKKRKDAATTGTAGQPNAEARAVASNLSEGKDNTLLSDKQEVEVESSGNDAKASTSVQQAVEAASAEVNTEPTPAQAEAGNYKKGHVMIGEFDITIENPAGSQRKGVDANGKEWHTTMANAYGYIKGTEGVDGDHIDVFLHSDMDQWNGRKVFVVDQTNTDGSFDEHKVMLGFNDKDEAMTAYLANYDKTWADTHPGVCISETNIENFNKWIESSHRKTKPFAEYSTVYKVTDEAPKAKPHKWVSAEDADEFDSLRDGLRNHFGKSTDMINEARADYGKPRPKPMDAEVLRMGTRMTYLMMKGGLRKFSDYCEAMKEELPDIIDEMRPHLKSLYAAAQNMEEVIELGWDEEMDDRKTVKAFDVYNFDKTGPKDIISTAQFIVDEYASQQAVNALTIGKEKKKRKKTEQQAALTSGLFDQIETENEKRTNIQPGTEDAGRGGQQPRPDEPLGEGAKHEDERTDGGRMAQRGGEHPVSDSDRGAGVFGLHPSERGITTDDIETADVTDAVKEKAKKALSGSSSMTDNFALVEVRKSIRRNAPKNTRNNHAERGKDYAPKGEKARIEANIAAIELAKRLLSSGATATPEEMAVLRKYSGWGGLGSAFNEGNAWAPNPVNKRMREVLTPEEYQAAVMSRNSAYYTPAAVIDAMWDVAKALGFKGGNIVEGSAGIGNIIGLMPADISERSNIHAVEIDPITGGILSLLYPDAKVEVQGFEKTRIANGSVDLAITNVPFVTDLHVMDESGDSDLSKKFRDIHDFCIAKNVRKLREGGIGIFITSSGTLDKSQKLRNWLVGDKEGNADVVGVFRMNNQTFGGTPATSDIIVVRKRVNGRKSSNAIDVSTVSSVRTVAIEKDDKTKDYPLMFNRYYIEHPEYMGGEMYFGFEQGDTYRPTTIGLFPTRTADQAARMAAWVQHLADMDWSKEQGKAVAEQNSHINEALGEGVKEGSMVTDSEGNLCVARMGRAVPLTLNKNKIKGRTKEECFKDYTEIKSALADVLKYQTEHDDDAGLQPLLDRLNRAYDTFVQRYGNLNKNNNLAWLRNDVDFSSIVALETYSEKGNKDGTKVKTYGKTDIFSRRVVEKESEPAPKNVKDGIIASIYKYGRIDTEYLATQLGKSQDDVKKEIVESGLGFVDPTTGQMEVSYEYLSGNVREKLRQAREANEAAGGVYDANIKALEAVVPMNIPAHLIEFALGSSWIEPQLYERYVKERTELDVKLTNAGGTWHMAEPWNTDKPKNTEMGVSSEAFGTLIPGHKLIEAAITNKTISVSRTAKDSDGGSHTETDQAATTACATKVDEIRQDFKDWAREQMQNDPALSMHMEQVYNEKFNNSVPKTIPDEFVPEHFGGAATTVGGRPFKLRPHQAKAVIRATTQPVLLAHEVGTGKTYTLITTAMEMRRLGTARKPMIVVQNATVGQFVASAKALYPNAKVLTLEDADRNAEGRRAFYAKIKFNDWDMIVVPQSVFERIPDSIERQTQFIQDKIEEKMLVLEQMKEADPDGRSMIVRAAEREISRLEDEMSQLASGEEPTSGKKKKDAKKAAITRQNAEVKARELLDRATDDVEDFDSMGIDAILVDEAHEYKHLGFATAMQRGVKGVDPSPSKKSQGVFLKTQAVLEKTGGKNVVFATGTPISNTAAEIWTFMRYLIPIDVMKEYDIYYFDDFVRNFGNLQQMLEFKTNGKYDEVNRFAGYVNLPELVRIWSTVADTVLTREAGGVSDKIPQMEGGKAQDIFLPQTRALRSIMKFVKEELDRYENMTGKEKKENSHIPLVMYGIAKAAAVDARLVQSDAEDDPNSKTNEAVRQTLRTLEETKEYKGTVAIFADNYQNKHSGFNLYEDIRKKLIAAGVPEEQVVVMKPGMKINKKLEIFTKVNAGEVRVVMGSTFTLGTGVNIQERLHTLIHLDAPNRPMDYTQRNGRILRQGNLHNTWGLPVRVLRFGVEDSLDVTAYQRLKTKGAIADSIMNGKQLMANSMENRSLEEDQDLFGDITAQLSGSEYAMLKNQIEKEVRKLRAAEKNWKADQTYIHNRRRQITGQNREAEKRIADNQSYLDKVEAATVGDITVGKLSFPSVDAMEDFFTEQNKKKVAMQEEVRTSGYSSRPATSDITISVGGFDFKIHTEITKEMKHQQGDLFATAPAKMTYSCPELGIDAVPVNGNLIKNAVIDIMENVVSGKDFRERIANTENYLERNNAELEAISKRDGQPFKDAEALEKAEEKLAEYEELMKAEMAAKEAKYAEMDKEVEAASGVELTEEDSEPTASEPGAGYGGRRKATVTGRSLFDWADDEEKAQQAMIAGQTEDVDKATSAALREADVALDRYAEAYNDYLDLAASMESQLEKEGADERLRQDILAQLEDEETKLYEQKEKLEETLRLYYELNNTHEDAKRIARDMVCRVEAEVATQHNRSGELEAILEKADTDASTDKENQAKGRVKTGGGYISYAALGHLPNPLEGEFSHVERQFSRTGEFSFTGNETVRDRGDVAYIFRALESYAVEHVFAAFVKDGRMKVLHIGMGGPASTFADLGAIRAGYDAFGADMIYLVHNHPSGNLTASGPDMALMRRLRAAFKGIPTEGLIIDTTSGRYRVFDGDGMIGDVASRPESGGENATEVVRFDHNERTDSDTEPVYITGPKMVEEFIGKMRFGTEHKVSYLVLSNSNEIIGNFHTGFESLADEGLAQEIASVTTKYAGTRAIVYGNARLDETQVRQLKKRIKEHSLESVELLDVLGEIKGMHASANDNGMMEPGVEYGNSLAERIGELAGKLHLENVEVVTDTTTLEGKRATAKGFYNKRTGKITIVLPNNASTIDAEQTLLHEAVAHYGLRQLFGDRFDTFLDNVFESAEPEMRRKIASMAREHGWNIRTATEEYLAGLAEDTDFEVAKEHAGWWTRIKRLFIDMVEKLGFRGFRDKNGTVLTDNELRYILWRSYENLKERGARGVMGEAADIAMQAELQVGNYAERGIEAEYATMLEDGIADKIEESFNAAVSGELRGKPIEIGVLTKEGRDYLEKLSGMKMKERVSFVLNPSDLVHIYRDHFGNNEKDKGNNIPLTIEDIRSIVDVVANPERIIFGKEPDGLKRNLFYFLAPAKEGTYNLLEIYGDRKGNLTAKTFYKTKKGVSQRVLSLLKSEHLTSVTDGSTLSGAKLPKFFENPTIEEEELFRPGDFTPRDKVLARDQYEKMVSSSRYQFTEAMQDSMLGLKELYRAISGKGKDFRIEDVAGFENAYLYENAMSSRNNSHAHRYFLSYMQPLLKEIGKICGANEQKRRDLMDYMMAKHGLERNEYMRNEATLFNQQLAADKKKGKRLHERSQVTDRDFAGLTGLTGEKDWRTAEATARQWVDDYEAATDTTALWKAVNNATKETLLTIYKSGMISKETHDKIAGMYAHYIPLRGWDETTSDEVYGYLTSKDGPLYGSIMKSAEGRSSKADDPIATIAKMADDAIRQGHRNIMKQRVLNFVLNHPSDLVSVQDLWLEHDDVTDEWIPVFADINDTDTPAEVEQKIEAFEQRMEALKQKDPKKYKRGREANGIPYKVVKGNLREHQVLVKRGGQTMVLTINGNPRAAQAINGLTNPDVGDAGLAEPIFKFMEAVNRQLSAFYTTRNPAFTLSNFIRDMQYANCTMWVKEDARYAKKFHINCCKFNPGKMGYLLHKWENGTLDTSIPIELKFEQFMLNGGETGYTNVKDIESYKRTVAAELKKQGSTARQKWAALGMALDLANRSIENCARFAAFVTSRELGRSIDRSIYDAKEVSVNFNKKGSGAKFAKAKSQTFIGKGAAWLSGFGRALWVFWGAGIQGMTNFGRMARRHPGKFARRVLMRLFLLGVAVPLLNMLFNMLFGDDGDDDKKAYYNLPEYTRRSNICLCFGRTSLTIPLPVEARAIYGLGELAFGAISGNERYSNKELAYQTAAQVSQVLPLDMLEGGGGFQALMPSALKPIAEPYWWNSSYTGMPIYRDTPFNKEDPEWTKAYASADKHFVGASKWLNEATGGDDFKKGAIDINPAKLEYMLRGFFGGLFSIPMESKKTAETIFGDREFEWRSIPILNRVFKSGDERTANRKIRDEYFKYQDEYKSTGRLVRKYENATDEGVLGYAEKLNFLYNSPEYARWLVFDDFKADMDAYKEMMSDETDPAKQKQIKAEMETEMRELVNALHNPDKYLESIYGKGGYPGIAEEETETE